MKRYIFPIVIVMLLVASCEAPEQKTKDPKFVLSDTMAKMVQIDTVSFCNIDNQLTLSGEVHYNENNVIKIFPRSSGQVMETKVTLGDKVNKGQILAVIRSADVAGNYSDLNSADADIAIAKRQMETTESLYKNGISSQKEYTEAKQNYQKALASKNKIASMIAINGGGKTSANGQYILTSPIDGYVVEKKINSGDFIRADNAENLFTISDLKNVWVYANVYETDITKVKEGNAVTVIPMAYADKSFPGKIDHISQVLDPQSKTMQVRVVLNNPEMLLKPDMFAKVVVSSVEGAMSNCVPSNAIIAQDGKNYVVIYNNDSDLKVAEVDVNKTVGNKTYINSGVQKGQKLVTKNQLFIFNQLLNE